MTEIFNRVEITPEGSEIVPLTSEEIALLEQSRKESAELKAKQEAEQKIKEMKRQSALAKLEALGLNEDDLKALGLAQIM